MASALCFGLFHGNLNQFFYAFLLGLVLAELALSTGCLWQAVLLHALVNLFSILWGWLGGPVVVTGVLMLAGAMVPVSYTHLANPGLESRFNKYFYFEDYNGAQLLAIFQSMCAKNGYTLDDKATEYAESYFKTLYEERDENFGNARDVRNVFERAVARQSDRVAALEKPGKEELMALTVADLQEEGGPVPDGAPDETLPESP